jgi:hypothetical protein
VCSRVKETPADPPGAIAIVTSALTKYKLDHMFTLAVAWPHPNV